MPQYIGGGRVYRTEKFYAVVERCSDTATGKRRISLKLTSGLCLEMS
jgi:hypothetical protein